MNTFALAQQHIPRGGLLVLIQVAACPTSTEIAP